MSIAIVTGGSGAIGSVICETLARRGDQVWCADLAQERFARAFADTPAEIMANIQFAQLDVTVPSQWEALCEACEQDGATIDTLVNAAAFIAAMGGVDTIDHEAWQSCFDVTLHGAASGVRTVGTRMAARGNGSIVNIASVVAHSGAPMNAGYATAKAALLGLTRTAAARLGRKGVRVNSISPGWVESPAVHGLFQAQARGGGTPEQAREAFIKGIPLQRLASPKDIAQAVAFLSSDAASYVTGVELTVDGGLSVA